MNKFKEAWAHLTDLEKSPVYTGIREHRMESLADQLVDENGDARSRAASALGKAICSEKSRGAAIQAMSVASKYDDWRRKWYEASGPEWVIENKGNMENIIASLLEFGGETHSFEDRIKAIRVLRLTASKGFDMISAVPFLAKALSDRSMYVREEAASTLWEAAYRADTDISSAILDLVIASKNMNSGLRVCAAKALEAAAKSDADFGPILPDLFRMIWRERTEIGIEARGFLMSVEPKNHGYLEIALRAAAEAKAAGRQDLVRIYSVWSTWSGKLEKRADALVADKKFPVPRIEPDKTERVLRVRRA